MAGSAVVGHGLWSIFKGGSFGQTCSSLQLSILKVSPSETKVKRREVRVCRDKHPQEKLARMAPVPADLVLDFTKRGMRAKRFEGSLRDDYF